MMTMLGRLRPLRVSALALTVVVAGYALPAFAQDTAETRLRRIESEVRALQRKVFPGPDGKLFSPEITAPAAPGVAAGTPATTPVTDMLARMEAIEAQMARLTAQSEQNTNRIAQLEARIAPTAPADPAAASAAIAPAAPGVTTTTPAAPPAAQSNLAAMTGVAPAPKPVTSTPAPAAVTPTKPATVAGPSPQRLAAVRAIEKPQTQDAGDDEYSYGYRLWEAKLYPEAAQQLKLFVDKYPRHSRISFGRNLLGRALLDDGKPREAASYFLQNYQTEKTGGRAPDSLLYLAVAMKQLTDSNRACIALSEFGETYSAEAAGRLKSVYDATRTGLKCNR